MLECRDIHKRFGSVQAVGGASLAARGGVVHAVVGENGAGKSTLLKVAAGLLVPDAGSVLVEGQPLAPHTASEALRRGVGMVQQHFALVEPFTALENIVLGAEPCGALGRLALDEARARVLALGRELGADIPLDVPVERLGVGDRQRIEIVRALFRDAKALILDEPTSVLAPQEADELYAVLKRLAGRGRAVVVVTHKLDEVRAHAGEVTAMRRGRVVLHTLRGDEPLATEPLERAIMGEETAAPVARAPRELGAEVLRVDKLVLGRALLGASVTVREREVVGVAGVEGNGQRELVRVLSGVESADGGTVHIEGGRAAVVHEDRHAEGLVLDAPVRDNSLLGELGAYTRFGVLDRARVDVAAGERVERGRVQPRDLDRPARDLSGGNQQKIVTVRAVSRGARVLVLAHPTRGVDLGAARHIHAQILEAAAAGAGVLVLSADLAELRGLADRIVVMRRGRFVATFDPSASDAELGAAMLGGHSAGDDAPEAGA